MIKHTMVPDGGDRGALARLHDEREGLPAGVTYRRCSVCGAREIWAVWQTGTGVYCEIDKRAEPEHCPVLSTL